MPAQQAGAMSKTKMGKKDRNRILPMMMFLASGGKLS
jgi:hypothetical protein